MALTPTMSSSASPSGSATCRRMLAPGPRRLPGDVADHRAGRRRRARPTPRPAPARSTSARSSTSRLRPIGSSRSSREPQPVHLHRQVCRQHPAGGPSTGITRATENAQGSPSKSARMVRGGRSSFAPLLEHRREIGTRSPPAAGRARRAVGDPRRQPKARPAAGMTNTMRSSVPISAAAVPMLL